MDGEIPDDPETTLAGTAGSVVPSLSGNLPLRATRADIAQFVAVRAAACVGADYSNLALLDRDDATQLRLFHGPSLDPAIAARYVDIPLDAPFPITAAIRDRRTIVLAGADDYIEQFPAIWNDTEAAGIEATVSVPLCRADGSPIGAMGFAWSASTPFDSKLEKALEAVGHLVTEIVERAEMHEAEHQLIADLHLRLLSELPPIDGMATAARYLPAGQPDAIGGDWFEGSLLDDGTFAVVVGDVTGHGLTAAADMALVRGIITALLHDGVEAQHVFARVSRLLSLRPGNLLATAALAVIDKARSTLTYATAGHPPPLMIMPEGTVMQLDQANTTILGVDSVRDAATEVPFPPGATLVMYTDGLVERRDRPFTQGIDEAISVVSHQTTRSPAQYIDVLVDALVGDRTDHDDIAVVVVHNAAVR